MSKQSEVICKACKEPIKKGALRCPHCQADQRNWFRRHILITIFIIIPFTFTMIVVAMSDTSEEPVTVNYRKTPKPTAEELAKIVPVFLANDFDKKSIADIKKKYGKPTSERVQNLPLVSYLNYQKDGVELQTEYLSNDKRVFGAIVNLTGEKCSPNTAKEQVLHEKLLKMVGIEYDQSKAWKFVEAGNKWMVKDYYNWENVTITCANSGDGYSYIIGFDSKGFMDRMRNL